MYSLPRLIKNLTIPTGRKIHRIPIGLYKDLIFPLELRTQMQFFLGLWENETHRYLARFTRDIATAVDAGAGIGEHTLFFLKKTTASQVVAFEPAVDLCSEIKRAALLNGYDVDAPSSRLKIYNSRLGLSHTQTGLTLDDFLDIIKPPCFVKIDVDGAELDILLGAKKLTKMAGLRFLVETHSTQLEIECMKYFTSTNYTTILIKNAFWRLLIPEERGKSLNRWFFAYNG